MHRCTFVFRKEQSLSISVFFIPMQIRNLLVNRYLCSSSCVFYFRIKAQNNTQIGFLWKYIFELAFRLMFLGRTGIWTDFCGGKDSGHHSPSLRQHTIQKHLKIVFLFLFLPLPFLLYSCFNRSLRRFTLLLLCFASPHTNFASLPLNVSKASSPSTFASLAVKIQDKHECAFIVGI